MPDRHGFDTVGGIATELGQVAEDRVVEIEETLGLRYPDGDGGEGLRDREGIASVVGDPTMSNLATAVEGHVQSLDSEVAFSDRLAEADDAGAHGFCR